MASTTFKKASHNQHTAQGVPFGRYSIRRRLAKGGMGEVFLADQLGPQGPVRLVALKRMLPKMAKDPEASGSFIEEMSTAARLNHPNIATTYDFGEVDGSYFLAMEYVEGLSLRQLLDALGPLPLPEVLQITSSVLDALAYAHAQPVVHRDISPHNILVSKVGVVKLVDFGIARTEAAVLGGLVRGKLSYAPPEQLQGGAPERRSDLWALGVVLYESLTGLCPFEGDDPHDLLRRALATDYLPLRAMRPEAEILEPLVTRALSPDPDGRWASAATFGEQCRKTQQKFSAAGNPELARLVAQAGGPPSSGESVGKLRDMGDGAPTETVPLPSPTLIAKNGRRVDPPKPPKKAKQWIRSVVLVTLLVAIAGVLFLAPDLLGLGSERGDAPGPSSEVKRAPLKASMERRVDEPAAPVESVESSPVDAGTKPLAGANAEIQPAPKRPKTRRKRRARKARSLKKRAHNSVSVDATEPATAKTGLGLLSVRAVPWARVRIDGKDVGVSPLARVPVEPGEHRLTAIPGDGDDLNPVSAQIRIRSGLITKVLIDFRSGNVRVDPK